MRLTDAFPGLAQHLEDEAAVQASRLEWDPCSWPAIKFLADLVGELCKSGNRARDLKLSVCSSLLERVGVYEASAKARPELIHLVLLRLFVANRVAVLLASGGQILEATAWTDAALAGIVPGNEPQLVHTELTRLDALLNCADAYVRLPAAEQICCWSALVFKHFGRMMAGPDLAESLLPYVLSAIEINRRAAGLMWVETLIALGEWAAGRNGDKYHEIGVMIEEAHNLVTDRRLKARLALTLTRGSGLTGAPVEWARRCLSEYADSMLAGNRLAALATLIGLHEGPVDKYLGDAFSLLDELQIEWASEAPDGIELLREQHFPIISPIIAVLLDEGRGEDIAHLLGRWYGIAASEILTAVSFCAASTMGPDPCWVTLAGRVVIRSTISLRRTTINLHNLATGARATIAGDPGYTPPPSLPGPPQSGYSDEYESALGDYLGFTQEEIRASLMRGAAPWLTLFGIAMPVQAAAVRKFGYCEYLSVSLRDPLPQRAIRSVCIWLHWGVALGHVEAEAVERIFVNGGAVVEFWDAGDPNKRSEFERLYQSDQFDVLWVIGHGHHDILSPGKSSLDILERESIQLHELSRWKRQQSDRRRLLYLNLCDAGQAMTTGGIGRYGIASRLCAVDQSVAAHLWEVEDVSAAVTGVLYADALVRTGNFLLAYREAISIAADHAATSKALTHLNELLLLDRWNRWGNEGRLLINTGSLALFC